MSKWYVVITIYLNWFGVGIGVDTNTLELFGAFFAKHVFELCDTFIEGLCKVSGVDVSIGIGTVSAGVVYDLTYSVSVLFLSPIVMNTIINNRNMIIMFFISIPHLCLLMVFRHHLIV